MTNEEQDKAEKIVLISIHDVREMFGRISTSMLRSIMKNEPTFPRPIRINNGLVRFPEHEITDWIDKKMQDRSPDDIVSLKSY